MARRVEKRKLIKNYSKYSGWSSSQCHWWPNYNSQCTKSIDPASSKVKSAKFCSDHWWICNFCDQKFPTYKTGRVKPRCDCQKSKDYIKNIKEEKNVRTIARELITQGMVKAGIDCSWHPSGSGKFTLYLSDVKTRAGIGSDVTLTIKDESNGSVVLGDRWTWGNQNLELNIIDPDYTTKACGFLIKRVLKTSDDRLTTSAANFYAALDEMEIVRRNIRTILPDVKDHNDKPLIERWQKIQTDVENLSTYLKDSVPEVEKVIGGLLNQDLEDSHE